MPIAMITRHSSIAGLRPTLSAKPPRMIEPKPMPTSSAESTTPSLSRGMSHSAEIPAEANALDSTTTIHCRALIGLSSITLIGLVPPAGPAILVILSPCRASFVDSRQHFHQFFDLFGAEAPLQPGLVLADAALGLGQCLVAGGGDVERLLAPVAGRALAAHEGALLQAVDDGHRRRPVHPQAPAEVDLRDARIVMHQPQRGDLLLGQVERGERLGEMAIDRAMGEADAQPEDVVEPAELVGALLNVVLGQSRCVHERLSQSHLRAQSLVEHTIARNKAARAKRGNRWRISPIPPALLASTPRAGSKPTSPTCSTAARSRPGSTARSTASSPTRSSRRALATTSRSTATG